MKNFFSNFFSSLLALVCFFFGIFFVIIVFVIIIASATSEKDTINIKAKSVLIIPTNQNFTERSSDDAFNNLIDNENSLGIRDVKKIIKDAKNNPNISAILIKGKGANNNLVICNQLHDCLIDFKSAGKKIYAYGSYNEKDFFIASTAQEIYAEPAGVFEWNGFGTQLLFFKKMMEKWNIKAQIFYAGKFKSATEPFRREDMSLENKLQISTLLQHFQQEMYSKIASNRKISLQKLIDLENNLSIQNLSDAQKYGFINGVKYSDEIEAKIKADIGTEANKDLDLISLEDYKNNMESVDNSSNKKIAVIYADGTIVGGNSDNDGNINTQDLIQSLREAQKDDDIKGIVLRINSPGGDAQASEKIWRAINETKKHKPLIASFGRVAASGGYYIAMGADEIFAEPFTVTGSIGVFAIIPNTNEFLSKQLGITYDAVGTSPNANFGIFKAITPMQSKFLQNHIDTIYEVFKNRVMVSRKLSAIQVENIAQGRVWSAKQAVQNGLVNYIGGLDNAISYVKKIIKAEDVSIVEYPKMKSTFEKIIQKLNKKSQSYFAIENAFIDNDLMPMLQQIKDVKRMSNSGQAQMKMPFYLNME